MRQLTKAQLCIFIFGALMMVVGAAVYVLLPFLANINHWQADGETDYATLFHQIGAVIYSIGAVGFASMQSIQRYEGNNFVIKRLRRIQLMGDFCFILAAALVLETSFLWLYKIVIDNPGMREIYMQYIYNNWVVALLIAAILEVYTTHRIAALLAKEK